MKSKKYKTFNINEYRPQVLFVGNGLFYDDCNWDEFINLCACDSLDLDGWKEYNKSIPYSIRANIACNCDDALRRKQYIYKLNELKSVQKIYNKNRPMVDELLKFPFDAILTTNYTYQIENSLDAEFVNRSERYILNHHCNCTKEKNDPKFLIHTYNRVNNHEIWHIHGEVRRKSSIVLTHDEYGRLSAEVNKTLKEEGNKYVNYSEALKMRTWMDYFLMGDVYVLGYAADFSEFVFWWMLGRRMREKAPVGKIFYYEPKEVDEKRNNFAKLFALHSSGVIVENMDCTIVDKNKDYDVFYEKAIADIESKICKGEDICPNL